MNGLGVGPRARRRSTKVAGIAAGDLDIAIFWCRSRAAYTGLLTIGSHSSKRSCTVNYDMDCCNVFGHVLTPPVINVRKTGKAPEL